MKSRKVLTCSYSEVRALVEPTALLQPSPTNNPIPPSPHRDAGGHSLLTWSGSPVHESAHTHSKAEKGEVGGGPVYTGQQERVAGAGEEGVSEGTFLWPLYPTARGRPRESFTWIRWELLCEWSRRDS